MPNLKEFLNESRINIIQSMKEEGLEVDEDNLRSLVLAWSLKGADGPTYHRVTLEQYTGRQLIELFSVIADLEEEELSESVE